MARLAIADRCYLILKAQCLITYCVATVSSEQCAARVDGIGNETVRPPMDVPKPLIGLGEIWRRLDELADWLRWLSLGAVVAIWPVGRPSQHQLPSSWPLRPVRPSSMESFDCF